MIAYEPPAVSTTPDGLVRLDLAAAVRDLVCDLASTAGVVDALDGLAVALARQGHGPDEESSADTQDAAVHEAIDAVLALLEGPTHLTMRASHAESLGTRLGAESYHLLAAKGLRS